MATGRLLGGSFIDDRDPESGENLHVRTMVLNMPVGLNDIMSSANKEPLPAPQVKGRRDAVPAKVVQLLNKPGLDPTGKPLTVEAWVKAEKPEGVVVARGGPTNGFALVIRKGVPRFVLRSKEELFTVSAKKKILGDWHHGPVS